MRTRKGKKTRRGAEWSRVEDNKEQEEEGRVEGEEREQKKGVRESVKQ